MFRDGHNHVHVGSADGGSPGRRRFVAGAARRPSRVCPTRLPDRPLVYLWTLPTTTVGLLALVLGAIGRGRVRHRVVDGVLEVHGGLVTDFLTHCTPLEGGASAMTLGHVVLGRDELMLDLTRDHERVHVRQCERWGPLFLPAYLLASAVVFLRRGRPYEDNPFEREAFALTTSPRRARR
jgi:hypothetical protein